MNLIDNLMWKLNRVADMPAGKFTAFICGVTVLSFSAGVGACLLLAWLLGVCK